jgi:hypothetical protein
MLARRSIASNFGSTRSRSLRFPTYKKNWFRSANFRRAISEAINREDLSARRLPRACPACRSGHFRRRINSGSTASSSAQTYSHRCSVEGAARTRASAWKMECLKTKTAIRSCVFHYHERGQQVSRTHGGIYPGRPAENRHPRKRGHTRLPFPDRAYDAKLSITKRSFWA